MAMNKNKHEAAKIVDPKWYPTYEQQIDALYSQASELNSCLFILEKVIAFPFRLFEVYDTTFWMLTVKSFFQTAVMCSWRIAVDNGGSLTLRTFKNDLFQHIIDPVAKAELTAEFKRICFDQKLKVVATKITPLRHRLFAHFQPAFLNATQGNPPSPIPQMGLEDLHKIRDAVNELIQLLGLDTTYLFLPPNYDPAVMHPSNADHRPDIVRLLDHLAEASPIMRMPEREPVNWHFKKELMSTDEFKVYKEYRHRFGLPEVA